MVLLARQQRRLSLHVSIGVQSCCGLYIWQARPARSQHASGELAAPHDGLDLAVDLLGDGLIQDVLIVVVGNRRKGKRTMLLILLLFLF